MMVECSRYISLAIALTLTVVVTACGSGSGNKVQNTIGPTAILNGASLAAATSHWGSGPCSVKVELTADGGFISAVTDMSGITYTTSGTWTASGTSDATSNTPVNQLTGISGSTASQSFSATQVGVFLSYQQSTGPCGFALQDGVIAMPGATHRQ